MLGIISAVVILNMVPAGIRRKTLRDITGYGNVGHEAQMSVAVLCMYTYALEGTKGGTVNRTQSWEKMKAGKVLVLEPTAEVS
jgi:hypothetical protein